ncbi:MAG TPA: STM4015 family protein [Steroidobacter sp.]
MTVNDYSNHFFGLPVLEFRSGERVTRPGAVYRLMQEYEAPQSQRELLDEFLGQVSRDSLEALIIGSWSDAATGTPPDGFLEALVEYRLPHLKALFVGDMTFEDAEISWINQTDYSALLNAYPDLEVLRIRGGTALKLPVTEHRGLRELTIETGGLPSSVVDAIANSKFPALKRLELWLGSDDYGFEGDLSTYQNLLAKIEPERLDYLGLRNSEIADQLATYLASQPWLTDLDTLDLSMGTLSDAGAKALLGSQYLYGLELLDLRHHYISDALVTQLQALPLTVTIDKAEDGDEEDRYVQVGE